MLSLMDLKYNLFSEIARIVHEYSANPESKRMKIENLNDQNDGYMVGIFSTN